MRRRGFFGILAGAVAAAVAPKPDSTPRPEPITAAELPDEWEDDWGEYDDEPIGPPGAQNTFVSPKWVAQEMAKRLQHNLAMSQHIYRDYSEFFEANDRRIAITASLPERYRR